MLNSETKRHIDAARDVLVGVAPNPTTQIDQITYALIYKFMDDMDQAAIKAGGNSSFFTGDLEPYAWSKLSNSRMGNQEKMNLYSEALTKFSESKQLPELFRIIFKSAFLPYRSPETLGLFLKEISYFDYSHPEELGNAYEYLLSIMSAQGDAGQFRTPRHIIDFIVEVLNPTKDDKVLDPSCGTAGFLVSTYNHILKQHDGQDDPEKREKPLTPDERKKLMQNLQGYDIDPTMVRIAQVNMYLHQFKNPQIFQYDTLTSEERWNEKFDLILANPPFMTPKGGIKPHNKFSLPSNRAEVLFVDYIVNHLRPKGRAGIIVPEGIIFQSGNAYKALRKNLVENGLYAVVSLPGGVFQPYSGVKTSILFFDNELAKQKSEIAFVKISADGYDLGATKREVSQNDLPLAIELLKAWANGESLENSIITFISKDEIAKKGEYNLSGERYTKNADYSNSKWQLTKLSSISTISAGNSAPQGEEFFKNGKYPFIRTSDVGEVHLSSNLLQVRDYLNDDATKGLKLFPAGTILFPKSGASTFLNHRVIMGLDGYVASHLGTINVNQDIALTKFVYFILTIIDAKTLTVDQTYPSLRLQDIGNIEIPLPPLEVQEQLVAELEGYAAIISGANQIIENWKPIIEVDPKWKRFNLGELATFEYGLGKSASETGKYRFIRISDINEFGLLKNEEPKFVDLDENDSIYVLKKGDILMARTGATYGKCLYFDSEIPSVFAGYLIRISFNASVLPQYFWMFSQTLDFEKQKQKFVTGGGQPQFNANALGMVEFSVPPIEIQAELVAKMEAEKQSVISAQNLIAKYEARTQAAIVKLWNK
jgi:type I restriction enzyme M protein